MNDAANELFLIRKYLLGSLKGEEREQLEERVLLDPEFRNRVLVVEENLIEEYAEGALEDEERQSFQEMFYANPQRRLEVLVVESLQQHAGASWWVRLLRALQDKLAVSRDATRSAHSSRNVAPLEWFPGFGKAVIAFAVLVTLVLAFLIVQSLRRPEQVPSTLTQDQTRHDLVERELARLNSLESQSTPVVAATLAPGLSRGDESQGPEEFPTVMLPRGTESAQLKLLLRPLANEYMSFQATLAPVGGRESYQVDLKPAGLSAPAPAIVLTLPTNVLDDGDYRVQLSGQTADGRTETLLDHYYYFRLVRQ